MNLFSLAALALLAAGVDYTDPELGRLPRVRKGFGLMKGPHTKRGHRKPQQKARERARLRAMTPLLPPQSGSRRFIFSSAEPNAWSIRRSLPTDEIRREFVAGLQDVA